MKAGEVHETTYLKLPSSMENRTQIVGTINKTTFRSQAQTSFSKSLLLTKHMSSEVAWHEDSVCSSSGECLECYQHMNPQREVDYASEV